MRPNILFLFSDEHSFRCMGHVSEEDGDDELYRPHVVAESYKDVFQ